MEQVILLIGQILRMFLYMSIGFLLFRKGKLSKQGCSDMAALLVLLVIPAVIVKSFCVEPTPEHIVAAKVSFMASVACLTIAMIVAQFFFPKRSLDNFAAAFSNAGFIGIPLTQATVGNDAVFYIASFIAILNILQWTYGAARITEMRVRVSMKTFLNPLVISTLLGIGLFFSGTGAKLPELLSETLTGLSALNAPMAMIVLGVYVAQADLSTLIRDPDLLKVSAVRLLLIPLLTLLLLTVLPLERNITFALLIAASTPVGTNVAVYAQIYGKDYVYASKTVVFSTLFSIVTMPVILLAANLILG